jgi:hypothetical protein
MLQQSSKAAYDGYNLTTDARFTTPHGRVKAQMESTALRLALVLIFLITAGCNSGKNVCPIDGQPPEGLWRRNGQSCEYFHYTVVEKKSDCPCP